MYKVKGQKHKNALDPKWEEGVYLGIKRGTNERYIGTPDKITTSSAVRRRPKEERWNAAAVLNIRGLPWDMDINEEAAEGQTTKCN